MKNFFKKLQIPKSILYVGLILLLVFFCITRLPFYLHYFFPRVTSDSVFYFYIAYLFKIGNFEEVRNLPMDLPMGMPLFYYALFNVSRLVIIYIQSILFFISTCFLFYTVHKYFSKKAVILLGIIILYYFDNSVLLFEFGYYTESLFISFIILFISFVIHFVYSKRFLFLYLIFGTMICLALIRSNGYVFFVAPLLFFALQSFQNKLFIKHLLIAYFSFTIFLSSLNLYIKGYFFPVEYKRIEATLNNRYHNKEYITEETKAIEDYFKQISLPKSKLFMHYSISFTHEKANYYYSVLPKIISSYHNMNNATRTELKDKITPQVQKEMLFDLLDIKPLVIPPKYENKDLYYFIHLIAKTYHILLKNIILYLLIITVFIYSIYALIKSRNLKQELFFIFFCVFLYFTNVLFTTLGNPFVIINRYVETFDILILFSMFVSIVSMKKLLSR
jgi:hypothetical protein